MNPHLSCLLHALPAPARNAPGRPLPPLAMYAHSSGHNLPDWAYQAPQSALFAGPLAPSSWTNAGPSNAPSFWPSGPPDFLLPFHHYPPKDYGPGAPYSVARSDTSSAISRDSDLSPSPEVAEVVCNAPLVAPVPLPYHSPTFLMYDLPDEDEDLSHPPYTHRPHKRKRTRDEFEDDQATEAQRDQRPMPCSKRRATGLPGLESSAQWAGPAPSAAPAPAVRALRHPAAAFSRRNRAR